MADPDEPITETIRVDPPPQSVSEPPALDTKARETVRIQLGSRQSSDRLPFRVPTEPSPIPQSGAEVLTSREAFPLSPAVPLPGAPSSSPNNETARIQHMPDPPSKTSATVQMKKTQPLISMPHAAPARPSIAVAPAEKNATPLCWVLLGVSAIILIIQIWTYFS